MFVCFNGQFPQYLPDFLSNHDFDFSFYFFYTTNNFVQKILATVKMANLAKIARGLEKILMRFQEILLVKWRRWQKWPIWRKICHEFGEYSNLIAKRGPLESGDFNENGNSGKKANSLKVKWGKIGGHIYRTSLAWLVPSLTRSLSSVTLLNDT